MTETRYKITHTDGKYITLFAEDTPTECPGCGLSPPDVTLEEVET